MTYGLLNVATVLNGDGNWTAGYEVDAMSCGRVIQGTDICKPITDTPTEAGLGYRIRPFGIEGHQKFSVRCDPEDAESEMSTALADASEYVVAKNFWSGDIADWDGADEGMFLADAGIQTVAAGADANASIAAALQKAYDMHPEIDPIVHMGLSVAFSLPASKADDLNIKWVVSPGYPPNGIAVTGPIIVRLGTIETLTSYEESVNRKYIQGTRIAAVEFDPCLAVVVA